MLSRRLSALTLLWIFLINNGCEGFPERPEGNVYNLNSQENIGYEMSTPKGVEGEFKYTGKDKPILEMDKFFCVSPEYLIKLKNWAKEVQKYSKEKCQ